MSGLIVTRSAHPSHEDACLGTYSPIARHRVVDVSSRGYQSRHAGRRTKLDISRLPSSLTSASQRRSVLGPILYYTLKTRKFIGRQTLAIRRRFESRELAGLHKIDAPVVTTGPLEIMSNVRTVESAHCRIVRDAVFLVLRYGPRLVVVAERFNVGSYHDVLRPVAGRSDLAWRNNNVLIPRWRGDLALPASIDLGEPRPGVAAAAGEQQARERDQQHQDEEERDEGVGVHHLRDLRSVRHHDHILSHEEPGVKHNFSTAELS